VKNCAKCLLPKSERRFYKRHYGAKTRYNTCKDCHRIYESKRRTQLPNYHRARYLRKYGLTLDQYNQMLIEQNGVCAICFNGQKRALSVDHSHLSNRVRALLCGACNALLGLAKENKVVLEAAIIYLDKHNNAT
jgi:hypothetical protein